MTPSVQCTTILSTGTFIFLALLSSSVAAYIPSVHSHDSAIVAIKKPSVIQPTSKKEEPTPEPNTIAPSIHASITRTKWGTDYEHPEEYWFDDRIHTLGNHGFGGAVHAALAPFSTKIIDLAAYNGEDIRLKLAQELSDLVGLQKARILDLCCGVGISTRALHKAFPDDATVIGIDTSKEMVAMANFLTDHLQTFSPIYEKLSESYTALKRKGYAIKRVAKRKAIKFLQGNAESTSLPDQSFDLVTVMWAFHEAPLQGRDKILKEARRLLSPGGILAVVDISSEYVPSKTMLQGEPYVQEYQENIHNQLQDIHGFKTPQFRSIVENHLSMWTLTRSVSVV